MSGSDLLETLEPDSVRLSAHPEVPALLVLWHPDPERVGAWAPLARQQALSRAEPTFSRPGTTASAPLEDPFVSRRPVHLEERPNGDWRVVATETRTRVEVDGQLVEDEITVPSARLQEGVVIALSGRVALLLQRVQLPRPARVDGLGMIGLSGAIEAVRTSITQVAKLDVPVLIRGESGVGKERVARALHELSLRARRPYEAVNMAALPGHLAAAELFGHDKGAFTGAEGRRDGCFVRTDGGTLFLDEIGDTPWEVQPQLLRVLETRDVRPLGATTARTVDVRIISATDARLEDKIREGTFRDALLHRLAGYQIQVPPLRARRGDVGLLLRRFLSEELAALGASGRLAAAAQPWLPASVVARLARYAWPGNVRQLRNVARQLAIRGAHLARVEIDGELEALLVPPAAAPATAAPPVGGGPAPGAGGPYSDPADVSDAALLDALRAHAFRVGPAARALGLSRTSMYARIEQSAAIRKAADLDAAEIEAALDAAAGRVAQAAAALEVSAHALKLRMTALGLRR